MTTTPTPVRLPILPVADVARAQDQFFCDKLHGRSCSCDQPACSQEVSGHLAEVAQQLAAGGWCWLRLEAIGSSRWASLCRTHGHALARGDRGPTVAAAGAASLWSELRLETVGLPGASYVCRLCPAHARALLAGSRLSLIAGRWVEDVVTGREIAALLAAG